jgi:hypothetical protein
MTTTQLDRIEGRVQAIDDRTRSTEIELAALRTEVAALKADTGHGGGLLGSLVRVAVAALMGFAGGHAPLPGGH